MRRACSTLAAALICAPAIAGAQDSQLQVLEQVIGICADARLAHGDWDGALADWHSAELDEAGIDQLAALQLYAEIVADEGHSEGLTLSDQFALHLDLAHDFPLYREDLGRGEDHPDSWEKLRLLQHDSGWQLALTLREGDPAFSRCELWHDAPAQDVMDLLDRDYLGLPLYAVGGIRARQVMTRLPAPPSLGTNSAHLWTMLKGEAGDETRTYPEGHPTHHAPEAMLRIELEATYRD